MKYSTMVWRRLHESGTKFYEAIAIWNEETSDFHLITRWGKNGAFGQIDIESCASVQRLIKAYDNIVEAKSKRGYFNTYAQSTFGANDSYSAEALRNEILAHYGEAQKLRLISLLFGDSGPRTVIEEGVEEPSGPEPDRGENWGAW